MSKKYQRKSRFRINTIGAGEENNYVQECKNCTFLVYDPDGLDVRW